jgi:hypothetical protein
MTTARRIPLRPNIAAQSVTLTLDGRRYRLDLDWIGRIRRWSFSLYTADGTPIVQGKGLVVGADLLRRTRYNPACPQGALHLVDLRGDTDAALDTLGVRHALYFTPLSEIQ